MLSLQLLLVNTCSCWADRACCARTTLAVTKLIAAHLLNGPFTFPHNGLHLFGNPVEQLARFITSALLEHGDLQAPVWILHRACRQNPLDSFVLLLLASCTRSCLASGCPVPWACNRFDLLTVPTVVLCTHHEMLLQRSIVVDLIQTVRYSN